MIKENLKKIIKKNKLLYWLYNIRARRILENDYIPKKRESFLQNGKSVFKDFVDTVYWSTGKHCWLCYGTLLGFIRENGIIEHDFDFDVGLFYDDYSDILPTALKNAGFVLKHQFKALNGYRAFEQTYEKSGVSIDVFFHDQDNYKIWAHVFYRESIDDLQEGLYRIRKLDYPKATFVKKIFLDAEVLIPENSEEYLEEIYGKNWKIPDPHYDWRKGPKNNCTIPDVYGIIEVF